MNTVKKELPFLITNNLLILVALIAAVFELPGVYIPFFAVSVALQITEIRKLILSQKK